MMGSKCLLVLIHIRKKGRGFRPSQKSVWGLRERILHLLQGQASVWPHFPTQTGHSGLPSFNFSTVHSHLSRSARPDLAGMAQLASVRI